MKTVSKITLLCFACFFIYGCAEPIIKNLSSTGEKIICFGDSLTFDSGIVHGNDYPSQLSVFLSDGVINAGRPGDTTFSALSRLDKDVLSKNPFLVIVILGGNDLLKRLSKMKTFDNLRQIIRKIHSAGAIVVLGELGPFTMAGYRKYYRKLAKEEGAVLIPNVLAGIFGDPDYMRDTIHPNAEGYKKLAKKVYDVILPIIESNRKLRSNL